MSRMNAMVLGALNQYPKYSQVDVPDVKSGESLIQLKFSALNHRDLWITKGMYPDIKLPVIPGSDGMGVVDDRRVLINPGWYWGDDERVQSSAFTVLGMPHNGTLAEYIAVPDEYIHDVPDHLTDEEAAALPLAGVTAYRTLVTRCQVRNGDKVLITGIGGGVAQMALMFAVAIGAEVYVTSGAPDKLERALAAGACHGVNYKDEFWYKELHKISGGFDVIIDSAGGDSFQHYIKMSNPGARIGFYGATLGKYNNINPQIMFWRQVSVLGSTMGSERDFRAMLDIVNDYKLRPHIDKVYALEDAGSAYSRMAESAQYGKIVLSHQ